MRSRDRENPKKLMSQLVWHMKWWNKDLVSKWNLRTNTWALLHIHAYTHIVHTNNTAFYLSILCLWYINRLKPFIFICIGKELKIRKIYFVLYFQNVHLLVIWLHVLWHSIVVIGACGKGQIRCSHCCNPRHGSTFQ